MVVFPRLPRPFLVTTAVFIGLCCLLAQHAFANSTSLRELLGKSNLELDTVVQEATTAREAALEKALRTYKDVEKDSIEYSKVKNFHTAEKVLSELQAEFDALEQNKNEMEKMGKFPHSKEAETVLSKLEAQFEALDDWKKEKMEKFRQAKEALKVADLNDAEAEGELEKAARQLADLDSTYKATVELLKNKNPSVWEKKTLAEIRDVEDRAQKATVNAKIEHLGAELAAQREPDGKSEASAKERAEKKLFIANEFFARAKSVREARELLDKSKQELKGLEEGLKVFREKLDVLKGQEAVPSKKKMTKAEAKQQKELQEQQLQQDQKWSDNIRSATLKMGNAEWVLVEKGRLLTEWFSRYY